MKIALISDIHGNLEALYAVKKSIRDEGAEKVFFLGDIVGYGANPNECTEMVRNMTDVILAGNHDWAAVGKSSAANFNSAAREAIAWTGEKLTEDNKTFLISCPLVKESEDILCVHSTPHKPEDWNYIGGVSDAERYFSCYSQSLCFIGHSHYPIIFVQSTAGDIESAAASQITVRQGLKYIINIGSVGQPRDGSPLSSYGIYDTKEKVYSPIRVRYPVSRAQKKILAAGLPPRLATRLGMGR